MPKLSSITSEKDALRLLAEKLRAGITRPNLNRYAPHDKQVTFHSSTKRKKLYIGGNRSGKTTGGIVEDIFWLRGEHPYRKVPEPPVRGRYVTTSLVDGVQKIALPEFSRWIPPSLLVNGSWEDSYDKQLRTLNFANESFVEFMSYDQDLDSFAGTSRHFTHYDEEPPKPIFTECTMRLLDAAGSFWITMTPVDGMTWVYDDLYEPGIAGIDSDILILEIDTHENPYLTQSEIEFVASGLDADDYKARIEGKFIHIGGLIYKMFHTSTHVLEKPVDLSAIRNWEWYASVDAGFNNPTAWLWHAVSPDNRIVTFDEHYASGLTVDRHAIEVHRKNLEHQRPPNIYIGDPSMANTDPITGTSVSEEYTKYGIPIIRGNNDVRGGISRMARYLSVVGDNKPNWMIDPSCVNFIRELQRYRWKTHVNKKVQDRSNPMEEPLKKDDHTCDSARYFIMSRPDLTPMKESPVGQEVNDFVGASHVYSNWTSKAVQEIKAAKGSWTKEYGSYTDDEMGGEW